MTLSARSCTLSSLRLSEALQKCQTVWQYVKLGIIAVRYKWSLVSHEMRLRSLANTPTFWLAFLHMSLTWSLKESSSSMFIPSIFRFLVGLICWSSIVMVHVCIKMHAVFTRKNKRLSRLYDRKFTPSYSTSRDGITCPGKRRSRSHCAQWQTPAKESGKSVYQALLSRFSLRNRTFKMANEFNSPSHLFRFITGTVS